MVYMGKISQITLNKPRYPEHLDLSATSGQRDSLQYSKGNSTNPWRKNQCPLSSYPQKKMAAENTKVTRATVSAVSATTDSTLPIWTPIAESLQWKSMFLVFVTTCSPPGGTRSVLFSSWTGLGDPVSSCFFQKKTERPSLTSSKLPWFFGGSPKYSQFETLNCTNMHNRPKFHPKSKSTQLAVMS